MKVLVTGGGGLLGSNVVAQLAERDIEVIATVHSKVPQSSSNDGVEWRVMDVTDDSSVGRVIEQYRPDWIVNCAAITDVDRCERLPDEAFEVNTRGAQRIAEAAKRVGAVPCQVSTDYVFGNNEKSPHHPAEELTPIQVYGRTKAEAERNVREISPSSLVVRISFLYGINEMTCEHTGIVPWILSESQSGNVPLYTDQYVSPTYASHAAEIISMFLTADITGVFHCNNRGCTTPYDLGRHLLDEVGRDSSQLTRTTLEESDLSALRPKRSCLSTERTERTLSLRLKDWKDGVNAFLDDI